jgi:hypothetical protein
MSVKRTNQQQNNKEKEEVYAIVDQELRDHAIKARDRILGYIDNYKGYVYSVTLGNGATLTTNSGDILDKYIKRYGKL